MVIDTSALIAILLDEPERRHFNELIESDPVRLISVASFVDLAQGKLAQSACSRYGKGLHRASLNFGDCFAYALAMHLDEPLLFKGNDFNQTDLKRII